MGCGCAKSKPPPSTFSPLPESSHKYEVTSDHSSGIQSAFDRSTQLKSVKSGGLGRAQFISDNEGSIHDFYVMEKLTIGEGAYGTVREARRKGKGRRNPRAVKAISKTHIEDLERFALEIAIMKMVDHPNVLKLYESFEDDRFIYLVLELCQGGELFERIIEAGSFTEAQAAIIMLQILRAVRHMHELKVVHRDLKCENFLFKSKVPIEDTTLKVIDYGLARLFIPGVDLTTKAGSAYYAAPEIQNGKYDETVDIWSCGCIMFVLMCGYPPFYGGDDRAVLARTKKGITPKTFKPEDWKGVSDLAKDFIKATLHLDPKQRLTAATALDHEWIKGKAPKGKESYINQTMLANLQSFHSQSKFKKAVLHIIAHQLHDEKVETLRDIFTTMDVDGKGSLTHEDVRLGIERAGLKDVPRDMQEIMDSVDADGSGMIDYTEFIAAAIERKVYSDESVLFEAFQVFDRNNHGVITSFELKEVLGDDSLGEDRNQKILKDIMKDVNTKGDGEISFEEFAAMMRRGGGASATGAAAAAAAAPESSQAQEAPAEVADMELAM